MDAPHVYSKVRYLPVTYAVLVVGAIMLFVVFFLDINKCHSVSESLSKRAGRVRVITEGSIEIYVIVFEQQGTEVSTGAIYNSHPYE